MFFYIGEKSPLQALDKVNDGLHLDKGWTHTTINNLPIWYKGYSTDCRLSDSLSNIINGYQPAGKWAAIYFKDGEYKLANPKLRGFPVYTNRIDYTNLYFDGYKRVNYDLPTPTTIVDNLSIDDASTIIGDILLENIANFYKYNDIPKLNALCSAGLDSTTSWAVLDSYTKDYTFKAHIPQADDDTFYKRMGRIREYQSDLLDKLSDEHWGYEISSFYHNYNWILTGFYAEVIQYRDGEALSALANYKGLWIDEITKETDYLHWFLKRPNIGARYKNEMLKFANEDELRTFLFESIFRDYQMWHLDNNMTFSPFADIRITETVHRMSLDDIIENSVNGTIQRNIIKRFKPDALCLVADYKNEKSVWANFIKNIDSVEFNPKTLVQLY